MLGIEDLIEGEVVAISDLEVGKIYKREFVIERTSSSPVNMVTLRRPAKDEIEISRYFVIEKDGRVESIMFNGYQDYETGEDDYLELDQTLKEAGL